MFSECANYNGNWVALSFYCKFVENGGRGEKIIYSKENLEQGWVF